MTRPPGLPLDRDAGPFAPPSAITRLRETRPVSPLKFPDGHDGWLVTGYAEVRQALADPRFSSRQDLGPVHVPYETPSMPEAQEEFDPSPQVPGLFLTMDPPDHTRLRRKLTGTFTVNRMKRLEEHIVEIAEQQLDHLAACPKPVDLVAEFALPVPSLVICGMLGVPYADRDMFQKNSAQIMLRDQSIEDKMAAWTAMTSYLGKLAADKRADPGSDILSGLARGDDLSLEELVGIGFLLLLAGHETTANMLALGTFALLENPEQLAALRADPGLIPGAVEELLRYLAVVDVLFRYASEDLELGGEKIPRGRPCSFRCWPRTAILRISPRATHSTSSGKRARICRSATACTNASASSSPGSKCAPGSPDCCAASRRSRSRSRRARCRCGPA
ncbi:hypothetical protein ATK30_5444 [Amycolatopsis echigonensis]|uniref:Cytochrome P450 n=1 Tax=Amycolatopsis echigonensis TaxID=2576905 RepID=A0A2N3WL47_9PSEU|nr:hypothetical protein ATK30_5444 [Amycolatopsis niigatensis]